MEMITKIKACIRDEKAINHTFDAPCIYIADYTEQSKQQKGLVCTTEFPIDIDSFVLNNTHQELITVWLFGDNIFIANEPKSQPHCEGVIFPTNDEKDTWLVFFELKYCKPKNLSQNLKGAREQLFATVALFRSEGIIPNRKLVHLIYAAPAYSNRTPFGNWSGSIDEVSLKKNQNIIIRGVNAIEVMSKFEVNTV